MALFIFGIIFVLAGLIIGLTAMALDQKATGIAVLVIGLVIGIAMIIGSCVTSVATGHTGIVTTFGRVEDYTLDAGVHGKAPWNKVIEMDNRVQKATIEFLCFSSDIQEVSCQYTINYQISKTNAQDLYRTIGKNYYETVITPAITESFKTVSARYTAEQLIGNRDTLASEIEEVLRENLIKYNIEIVSTAIEDLDFSDAYTEVIEKAAAARQEKIKAEVEQEQKTMEAEQAAERAKIEAEANFEVKKIEAEAQAEIARIKADADLYAAEKEAEANQVLSESITSEIIKNKFIDFIKSTWNGELPDQLVLSSDELMTILNSK